MKIIDYPNDLYHCDLTLICICKTYISYNNLTLSLITKISKDLDGVGHLL